MSRLLMVICLVSFPNALWGGQILSVTISDPTVFASFNGAANSKVDIQYEFLIDANDVLLGQGVLNGDLWTGLNYTVSSNALGLNRVAATNQLDFELNPDKLIGSSNDGFMLYTSGAGASSGVSGFGGVLNAWDRSSPLQVTGGSGPTSVGFGGFQTSLVNGDTLGASIFNFFDTTVAITTPAVPEPSSLLLAAGLAGLGLCQRKKRPAMSRE